jgi:hypothetical protein
MWSASRPCRSTPRKSPSDFYWMGGWVDPSQPGRSGEKKNLALPGIKHGLPSPQPVAIPTEMIHCIKNSYHECQFIFVRMFHLWKYVTHFSKILLLKFYVNLIGQATVNSKFRKCVLQEYICLFLSLSICEYFPFHCTASNHPRVSWRLLFKIRFTSRLSEG